MNSTKHTHKPESVQQAVDKFYLLNDDLHALRSVGRQVFFEFLRTSPVLSTDDVDTIRTVVDLVAELCRLKEEGKA